MTHSPATANADLITAAPSRTGAGMARKVGIAAVTGWAAVATAVLVMDRPQGAGGAQSGTALLERQLDRTAAERDARAADAAAAQQRFAAAVDQVSAMQRKLLAAEERQRELESGIGAMQASLHDARAESDAARRTLAAATATPAGADAQRAQEMSVALDVLSGQLKSAADDRDASARRADQAVQTAQALTAQHDEMVRRNGEIFAQLEDAVSMSVKPLDDMFAKVGVDSDKLLETVRRGYEGEGGPLTPMGYSTHGNAAISQSEARANEIVVSLGKINNYRIAVSKLPLAMPIKSAFRFTSPYGQRWGRGHEGIDMAGPVGTPIYATGDGVVIYAGWMRGYGNLIKIRHEMGTETRYGHLSKINVRAGQKVSRNSLIGAMGNTGRSTGPHLHYEVRVDGKAVNPMSFIKAAQNVF